MNPIGAHSMLQLDDPPSFMEAMFAQAAAMHASAIRLDVAPALVFANQSQPPDFSGLDEVVALAQRYHLRVVGDLLTIPPWMAQCATPTSNPSRCATGDLAGYASVIGQIVSRADPVIRDWEVWNEPDTAEFFDGTAPQYAFMLRTAHDAIKSADPADNVLLGGVSGVAATDWLARVFATPGADAVHAFDVANLHERGDLWQLAPDVAGFQQFLAAQGFGGPLWVTEHGYPSDPAYQYDPGYTGGDAAQASFLQASLPTLIDAGAAEVLVTERDNLAGPFASEGVLGGDVADPPPADPQVVTKPAFAVVQTIADCYQRLGRDCPGLPPTASPSTAFLPPVPPGHASTRSVAVTDPGSVPVELGPAGLTGPYAAGLSVASDGCAGMVLEPRETCRVLVRFAPAAAGDAAGSLQLSSDDGVLDVPLIATAPSLSGLLSPELPYPQFVPTGADDGVGYPQRWRLTLTNPFRAGVRIARAALSGIDARRFVVTANRCTHATLRPHGSCRLEVIFTPTRPGTARGRLTLVGTGTPLVAQLRPVAFALPAVARLTAPARHG
ncbi:MAG: choice-of-anchor D domain-containing protein, partial [Solirubrobacteraceae bacterium]